MGDVHDGVNFMRAACVIAVEKAKASFEPMLEVCNSFTLTDTFILLVSPVYHISYLFHFILFYSILLDFILLNNVQHFI